MIKVGIIGGGGYTAGELLRILVGHPETQLVFVQSKSQTGRPVTAVHPDLTGEITLDFVDDISSKVEVIFLCSGHGKSKAFLLENTIPEKVKIIDLSSDFRLAKDRENFIYGLPELNRAKITKASKIANPGCFATAIQLALLPLAASQSLDQDIHVHALTGSTGAGQQPTPTTHFSWRNNNASIYKPFVHQHLGEIRESLTELDTNFTVPINFLPLRGNFTRGIFASLYFKSTLTLEEVKIMFSEYYKNHPFVHLVSTNPSLTQVVNTNKCYLFLQKIEGKILIISTIDNLIKGASGQAVQNMNLMFGLEETLGLRLKGSGF